MKTRLIQASVVGFAVTALGLMSVAPRYGGAADGESQSGGSGVTGSVLPGGTTQQAGDGGSSLDLPAPQGGGTVQPGDPTGQGPGPARDTPRQGQGDQPQEEEPDPGMGGCCG